MPKVLNVVSALALSTIVLGAVVINPTQAMDDDKFPNKKLTPRPYNQFVLTPRIFGEDIEASRVLLQTLDRDEDPSDSSNLLYYTSQPGIVIDQLLSDELLLMILKFREVQAFPERANRLALTSKHFLALINDPQFSRTIIINSPKRREEVLKAKDFPDISSVPGLKIRRGIVEKPHLSVSDQKIYGRFIKRGGFVDNLGNTEDLRPDNLRSLLSKFPFLTSLNLSDMNIGLGGAAVIAEALPNLPQLKKLNLYKNNLTVDAAEKLAVPLSKSTSLKELRLDNNDIHLTATHLFIQKLCDFSLEFLDLSGNKMTPQESSLIFTALKNNKNLKQLKMLFNKIDLAGSKALEDFLKINSTLTKLSLMDTYIDHKSLVSIVNGLKSNSFLKSIDVAGNDLGPEGAKLIAGVLKHNDSLTDIDLFNTKIGDEGCIAIANNLNSSLVSLNLGQNGITHEGANVLSGALSQNTTLKKLNLLGNDGIGIIMMNQINDIMSRKTVAEKLTAIGFCFCQNRAPRLIPASSSSRQDDKQASQTY